MEAMSNQRVPVVGPKAWARVFRPQERERALRLLDRYTHAELNYSTRRMAELAARPPNGTTMFHRGSAIVAADLLPLRTDFNLRTAREHTGEMHLDVKLSQREATALHEGYRAWFDSLSIHRLEWLWEYVQTARFWEIADDSSLWSIWWRLVALPERWPGDVPVSRAIMSERSRRRSAGERFEDGNS